jgi:hypothetical protein
MMINTPIGLDKKGLTLEDVLRVARAVPINRWVFFRDRRVSRSVVNEEECSFAYSKEGITIRIRKLTTYETLPGFVGNQEELSISYKYSLHLHKNIPRLPAWDSGILASFEGEQVEKMYTSLTERLERYNQRGEGKC